jgi:hypothetical protein
MIGRFYIFVFHFNIISVYTPQTVLNVRISCYHFKNILYVYSNNYIKYMFYLPSILLGVNTAKTVSLYPHLIVNSRMQHGLAQSFEAQRYKSEGYGFDSR